MKIVGCLPRNACFDAPTCLVSSLWFSCGLAVAMGEAANLSCFKVSKQVVTRFCVAGVPLRDILTCLQTSRKSFCVAGAILMRCFQKMRSTFSGRRNTGDLHSHFAWQAQHFRCITLRRCVFFAHTHVRTVLCQVVTMCKSVACCDIR